MMNQAAASAVPVLTCPMLAWAKTLVEEAHLFFKESILGCQGEQLARTDAVRWSQLGREGLFLLDLAVITNDSQKFGTPGVKSVHMIYLHFTQKSLEHPSQNNTRLG